MDFLHAQPDDHMRDHPVLHKEIPCPKPQGKSMSNYEKDPTYNIMSIRESLTYVACNNLVQL